MLYRNRWGGARRVPHVPWQDSVRFHVEMRLEAAVTTERCLTKVALRRGCGDPDFRPRTCAEAAVCAHVDGWSTNSWRCCDGGTAATATGAVELSAYSVLFTSCSCCWLSPATALRCTQRLPLIHIDPTSIFAAQGWQGGAARGRLDGLGHLRPSIHFNVRLRGNGLEIGPTAVGRQRTQSFTVKQSLVMMGGAWASPGRWRIYSCPGSLRARTASSSPCLAIPSLSSTPAEAAS
jgi:hypothetical protein